MCNEIFKLDRKLKENGKSELFLATTMEVLKSNLLSDLKGNEFKVYIAIATFMDDKGECCPSQETIATLTNMSLPTVNSAVNSLLKKKIGDTPILLRKLIGTGSTKYSNYRIPMLNEEVLPYLSTKDILKMFEDKYAETFGVPYKPNYIKDMSMIKNSLLPNFTDEQIRAIIDTIFAEFDKRWKTPQYQAPTIGAVCSWMANQALKLSADRIKAKTSVSKWDTLENSDEDLIL